MSDRIYNVVVNGLAWTFDLESEAMKAAKYARDQGYDVRDPDPEGFNCSFEFEHWLDQQPKDRVFRLVTPNDVEIYATARSYEEACVEFIDFMRENWDVTTDEEDEELGGWLD